MRRTWAEHAQALGQRWCPRVLLHLQTATLFPASAPRQVAHTLAELCEYRGPGDLRALEDIRDELVESAYLEPPTLAALQGGGANAALGARGAAARGSSPAGRPVGHQIQGRSGGSAGSAGVQAKGKARGGSAKGAASAKASPQAAATAATPASKAASRAAAASVAAGTRRFLSPSGFEIVVGRNNRGNEHVSHSLARPGDLWMHVQGAPGCHALLRASSGSPNSNTRAGAGSPSDADVQACADLASHFSSLRLSTKCPVIVVDPKHVKKARGGRPGMVQVEPGKERTVWGRPEDGEARCLEAGAAAAAAAAGGNL